MRRQDRQRCLAEETGAGQGHGEAHRRWPVGRGVDALPGGADRAVVLGILQQADGEDDVGRGDGLAVLPEGVAAHLEGVGVVVVGGRPAGRQVRHDRAVRPVLHQPAEEQRDEVLVHLGTSRQRVDRAWTADDALAVRHGQDAGASRTRRLRDGAGEDIAPPTTPRMRRSAPRAKRSRRVMASNDHRASFGVRVVRTAARAGAPPGRPCPKEPRLKVKT